MEAKTLAKYLIGGPELLASAVTGAVAEPIAGWGGILATTAPGADAGKTVEGIRDRLTYSPRSSATQELSADIAGAVPGWIKALSSGYGELADKAGEVSPALGAAVATLPAAAGTLVPYAGRVKALGESVPEGALNRQAGILRGLSDEEALLSPGVAALKEGRDPYDVWGEFGVGEMPGIPGKYFDEIDDSAAYIPDTPPERSKLAEYLKHPELYKNVPVMRYADKVPIDGPVEKGAGYWDPKNMELGINPKLGFEDEMNVALHEAQHGVAGLTGLPQGTAPSKTFEFFENVIDLENKKKAAILEKMGLDETTANDVYHNPNSPYAGAVDVTTPEWEKIKDINGFLRNAYEARNAEYKKYHNNYGEALARMAEARKNMDKTARSISYPFDEETFLRQTRSTLGNVLRNFRGE